jgi:hypothetical protein
MNGLGFIYINGCNANPNLNCEHMHFSPPPNNQAVVSEATARFNFNNAASGGKLLWRGGGYRCLGIVDVMSFTTNELLIVTLRDDGSSWYGAFIGDYTLINPDYMPEPGAPNSQPYSVIGLLRNSVAGLDTLALTVVPSVRRFATINCTVRLQTSSAANDLLEASFAIQNGGTYALAAEVDRALAPTGRRAGVIYSVGQGSPCTNLPQREVAVDSFQVRL